MTSYACSTPSNIFKYSIPTTLVARELYYSNLHLSSHPCSFQSQISLTFVTYRWIQYKSCTGTK